MSSQVMPFAAIVCLALVSRGASSQVGEWVEESGFYQSIRTTPDSPILKLQSKYQAIEIHKSIHYGKILVLDGVLQLTEKDADAYNEMLAHVPLFQHPNPRRVLIVGGGDGQSLSLCGYLRCWFLVLPVRVCS
jgi:spermidine synthase